MLPRMNGFLSRSLAAAALLALSACSTVVVEPASNAGHPVAPAVAHAPAPGGHYEVQRGDTLYSIAFRNGVDFRNLAQWNGIAEPYTIWPGQRLSLSPPSGAAPASHATVAAAPAKPAPAPAAPSAPVFESVPTPTRASTPAPTATSHAPAATGAVVAAVPHAPPAPVAVVKAPVPAVPASTEVPVAGEPKASVPPPAPAVATGSSRASGGVTWRWPADGQIIKRFTPGDAVPGVEIAGKAGDPVRAAADGVVVYSGNGLVGYGELVIIKHNDSLLSAYGHNSKRLVKEGQRVSAGQQIAEMGSSGASRVELGFQIRKDGNPVDPLNYLPPK
ncbi:MAG: peptidase M23 [Rhodanobacter sp. 68-29]|nr:peptidoglycan DD-metalloendopeptidase family protein [Rhodanobacter sp.]ODU75193.1 MAG: peptidase M23 [Rhodanobacter sp. SCN 69-32]OJY59566.1 MAG: peptidase M23 [Rhodanobacter sp. 68-29]